MRASSLRWCGSSAGEGSVAGFSVTRAAASTVGVGGVPALLSSAIAAATAATAAVNAPAPANRRRGGAATRQPRRAGAARVSSSIELRSDAGARTDSNERMRSRTACRSSGSSAWMSLDRL